VQIYQGQLYTGRNQHLIDIANKLEVCFGLISVVEGRNPASVGRITVAPRARRFREYLIVRFVRCHRALLALSAAAALLALAQPASAGMEEAVKAMQAGDMATAETELQVLVKERDPRAQFFAGLYIYGNPDSKFYDVNKATPMLLDAAERGYVPAMLPIAGAYAEGKGLPKSLSEAYKWVAIAERWHGPVSPQAYEQLARDMKPDEIEKAKAAAAAYTFKPK
jgi:hypothetical protein